jgi:hypothetical protein
MKYVEDGNHEHMVEVKEREFFGVSHFQTAQSGMALNPNAGVSTRLGHGD